MRTDFEAELKQLNSEKDHVHLLVHYPAQAQSSKLVNSASSRRLRQEYDAHIRRYLQGGHSWSAPTHRKLRRCDPDRPPPIHREPKAPHGLR
ncbi:transposase [Streptomyces sp. NPDC056002]|uniref:transposase n=1 Tax=Streptomyces sp. NPDC056002 TaxID=3345675 RepID=UPI0035D93532